MPSKIAWLDSSREEQRRMREILNLFSETESRDELGVGQIRDAFSDSLFPGTSTLHTRARYFVLVPWCFQSAERRGLSGPKLAQRVDRNERSLIGVLRKAGETDGLIGQSVGTALKNLPSALYWSALGRYRIRLIDASPEGLAHRILGRGAEEANELVEQVEGPWCSTLPPVPTGFPDEVDGGLDLSAEEARWLSERILEGASDSLLTHLLSARAEPSTASDAPWSDASTTDAPGFIRTQLVNAELFSLTMHGAALLYNLLIAERYAAAGHTKHEDSVEFYREALGSWAAAVDENHDLPHWDRRGMWDHVIGQNERIAGNAGVRHFVNRWLDGVNASGAAQAADDDALRRLVETRERTVKRAQSRLVNQKLLRDWSGASGSKRLIYRWPNVKRLVGDIHNGLRVT